MVDRTSIREPEKTIDAWVNRIHTGNAKDLLTEFPCGSVDLIVTSPPYWTAVAYDTATEESTGSYEQYIEGLLSVWKQCSRVLRPNGKLAINSPIMPIPKTIIGDQHTRHIKHINNDIEHTVLSETDFLRYSLFIWQKQTSKLMFGSYPYPGNLLENNTIEFINVFVKPGKPPKYSPEVKESNKLSRDEWIDLVQQVWFIYPEDVQRSGDHPAPFPEKLAGRLIRLYTYGSCGDFPGEIVLDPFCGTGTACVVAKRMGRRFIGIDICEEYVKTARLRVTDAVNIPPRLLVGRAKYPGRQELEEAEMGTAGRTAERKHKRTTYGRSVTKENRAQPLFDKMETRS